MVNPLPDLLGSRESAFIAERPFHDLAADINALFDLAPDDTGMDLPPSTDRSDLSNILPPSDSFASLFSDDDREFWEQFMSGL
jgi:hypothetical protein